MFGPGRCQRESLADKLCHDSRSGPSLAISGAAWLRRVSFAGAYASFEPRGRQSSARVPQGDRPTAEKQSPQHNGSRVGNPAAADRLSSAALVGGGLAGGTSRVCLTRPYHSRLVAARLIFTTNVGIACPRECADRISSKSVVRDEGKSVTKPVGGEAVKPSASGGRICCLSGQTAVLPPLAISSRQEA